LNQNKENTEGTEKNCKEAQIILKVVWLSMSAREHKVLWRLCGSEISWLAVPWRPIAVIRAFGKWTFNVEVTCAARLYRAASGGLPGWALFARSWNARV